MISLHLEEAMLCDKFTIPLFRGVFAADNLPRIVQNPCVLIANTDPINKSGSHWISIHIDEFGRGEFFDSYGIPPIVKTHHEFLSRQCTTWTYNEVQLQSPISDVCGEYAALFLAHRARGLSMQEFLWFFQNRTCDENDELARAMFYEKFKSCFAPVRKDFQKQICCNRISNPLYMMRF
jgi:hypothetical protein